MRVEATGLVIHSLECKRDVCCDAVAEAHVSALRFFLVYIQHHVELRRLTESKLLLADLHSGLR